MEKSRRTLSISTHRRGSASMLCLFMVMVAILVGCSITVQCVNDLHRTRIESDSASALELAEAGADYTLGQMEQSGNCSGTAGNITLGGGYFNATVTYAANNYTIHSTGKLNDGFTKCVDIVLSGLFPDDAIISNGGVSLSSTANTVTVPSNMHVASIRSNKNINATGSVTVDGSMIAAGTVNASSGVSCYDPAYPQGESGGPAFAFPTSSQITNMTNGWLANAQSGGSSSAITVGGGTRNITGPLYINGDLTVSGNGVTLNISGSGTVYVNGNVAVKGGASMNNSCNLVATGTITISGGSTYSATSQSGGALISLSNNSQAITVSGESQSILMGMIYAVNGGVTVSGSGAVYGGIIAGGNATVTVTCSGSAKVIYPAGLYATNMALLRNLQVSSWLEK